MVSFLDMVVLLAVFQKLVTKIASAVKYPLQPGFSLFPAAVWIKATKAMEEDNGAAFKKQKVYPQITQIVQISG